MKRNKAFTLVEMFIVCIIIGLLAAMAIPAFQKVKQNGLVKAYEQGQRLDKEQLVIVRDYYKEHGGEPRRSNRNTESNSNEYKTIVIDGKTYKLVPQ